jgi:flavodoxin
MSSIVLFGSRFGNTQRIAEEIAAVLGERGDVRLLPVQEAATVAARPGDLLVVGGPTEGHTMTPAVRRCLDAMASSGLGGVAAAAFDTRVSWPRLLSGSAAAAIARQLRRLGAHVIHPEGSFIVTRHGPGLEPGELERARAWATTLAEAAGRELVSTGATPRR